MDKELRERLISTLEEAAEHLLEDKNSEVLLLLKDEGYLAKRLPLGAQPSYKLLHTSIAGYKYLERLKHPRKAWLKKNWFAVSIAAITAFIGLASVIVQIVSLILD